MSGGHWDYEDGRIGSFADRLAGDHRALAKTFGVDFVGPLVGVLEACGSLLHDMDWHICSDARIEDPAARLRAFKDALREACR